MHIHFVCTGNSYRSRLAEAYCKSKTEKKEIVISSSGTSANEDRLGNGPISWCAMRLMTQKQLIPHMSWEAKQTTLKVLKDVDLLICMRQSHLDYCQDELGYIGKFELWEIPDLNEMDDLISSPIKPGVKTDIDKIRLTEQTYDLIASKVDDLIKRTIDKIN